MLTFLKYFSLLYSFYLFFGLFLRNKFCAVWLVGVFCVFPHIVLADAQPADIDYYIQENADFSFIFSKNFLENNTHLKLKEKVEYYNNIYKSIFSDKFKDIPVYIFISPKNQVSNANVVSFPFLRMVAFPTGTSHIDKMGSVNWLDTIVAHEMAHIYQLGQFSDRFNNSVAFKNVTFFGFVKSIFGVILSYPLFFNINTAMPRFFLEGHAVLIESLFSPGGRLYSGAVRALVFAQLKHNYQSTDHFIAHYLVNRTNRFFSIDEKYQHGGYFFSTLLEKFKLKKINHLFKQYSENVIYPGFSKAGKNAFENTLGTGFENLVHYYINRYRTLALQQKQSLQKPLFKSSVCMPFNRKDQEVFFLTSDANTAPVLRMYNQVSRKWKSERKRFELGKVFKIKDKYYVSHTYEISPIEKIYGLFSDGMYFFDKKYHSQDVQDMYNQHWLSIDTTNNMESFRLLLDGKFYNTTHSTALFGPNGSVYYFKQKGHYRAMYKDKKKLFQFKGFYGKPIGVSLDGTVFFIASSSTGSSLFAWAKNRGIYRVSSSDVIIEAINLKKINFLFVK